MPLLYHLMIKTESKKGDYSGRREPTFEELTSPEVMRIAARIRRSREYREEREHWRDVEFRSIPTGEDLALRMNC